MKRIYIVNPVAGNGRTLNVISDISNICSNKNYNYEIITTTHPMEAALIAKEYSHADNVIFSVGGNGTLNEIINGIKNDMNFSIVPSGLYNSFSNYIGKTKTFNLDKVNDRYFIDIAFLGIDIIFGRLNIIMRGNIDHDIIIFMTNLIENKYTIKELDKLRLINSILESLKGNEICSLSEILINYDGILKCSVDGEIIESSVFKFTNTDKVVNYYREEDKDLVKLIKRWP